MENHTHAVLIDIPKRKECAVSAKRFLKEVQINRFLKQSMAKRSTKAENDLSFQKYILPRDTPLTSKHFKRDELLVPFKVYTKHEAQDKHKQKFAIQSYDKYKVKQRLHVEYLQDDVQAATDIDKDYYNYMNGRIMPDRVPIFKSLKRALAELHRNKHEIGIRNDAILNIKLNCRKESEMYDSSLNRFMAQVKCLEMFISEDYRKSMGYLGKWEKLKFEVHIKLVELQCVASKQFRIISRLMGLDYLYSKQQKYGRFLYYLSPPSWRAKNRDFAHSVEIATKGFDLGYSSEEETFNVIFEKMQKEYLVNIVKPVLYFTHPHDLMGIFHGIEKQQLHHFAYVTHLAPHKKMLNEGIAYLKDIIHQESTGLKNIIQKLELLLETSEKRCTKLKNKFFRVLNGLFYESVGAPEVLKLFVNLKFCYESVFVEKPINLDIVTMAKALEACYMDYAMRLDDIHGSTLKTSIIHSIEKEQRKIRRARIAARELSNFDRLTQALTRAYLPTVNASDHKPASFLPPIKGAEPKKYMKIEHFKSNINDEAQNTLTESEIEYLSLFTDWTEGDDPAKYLHRVEDDQ